MMVGSGSASSSALAPKARPTPIPGPPRVPGSERLMHPRVLIPPISSAASAQSASRAEELANCWRAAPSSIWKAPASMKCCVKCTSQIRSAVGKVTQCQIHNRMIESNGTQTVATDSSAHPMPPVPRLTNTSSPNSSPNNTTGADAAAAAATAEANTLREQLTTQSGHVEALEKQLAALKAMVEAHTCSRRSR